LPVRCRSLSTHLVARLNHIMSRRSRQHYHLIHQTRRHIQTQLSFLHLNHHWFVLHFVTCTTQKVQLSIKQLPTQIIFIITFVFFLFAQIKHI